MPNENNSNGWNEWSKYVLKTLEKAEDQRSNMSDEIVKLRLQVENLQTRSKTWGAVGGALTSIGVSVVAGIIYFVITKE